MTAGAKRYRVEVMYNLPDGRMSGYRTVRETDDIQEAKTVACRFDEDSTSQQMSTWRLRPERPVAIYLVRIYDRSRDTFVSYETFWKKAFRNWQAIFFFPAMLVLLVVVTMVGQVMPLILPPIALALGGMAFLWGYLRRPR